MNCFLTTTHHHTQRLDAQNILMKYENRRYNKNETSKEFYLRRKKEMSEALESDVYKKWYKKIWAEYKEANKKIL